MVAAYTYRRRGTQRGSPGGSDNREGEVLLPLFFVAVELVLMRVAGPALDGKKGGVRDGTVELLSGLGQHDQLGVGGGLCAFPRRLLAVHGTLTYSRRVPFRWRLTAPNGWASALSHS